jgi:DNA-binding transcriptional LysR family regulator
MAHNDTWDDLRFLLAVAEAGSVNAAAGRLGVNHATVLRRIGAFEARTGVTLFQKSARGYRLDPGAAPIMDAIRAVEAAVGAVDRAMAGEEARMTGALTITSTDSLSEAILPRHLRAFQRAHPNMSVKLKSTNARLNLGEMDADVTIRPAQDLPDELVGRCVGTMTFRVYGTAERLADKRAPWLGVSELLEGSPIGAWQRAQPDMNIVFRADSFMTLAATAVAGVGMAMLPDCVAQRFPELEAAPDAGPNAGPVLSTNLWVAAHRDVADAPRLAICRRFFEAALAQDERLQPNGN